MAASSKGRTCKAKWSRLRPSAPGAAPGPEGRNLDHFALQVRPFDEAAIRAHLAAHGVTVIEEGQRYGADGTGFSLYVRDPEGNTVELKGPSG